MIGRPRRSLVAPGALGPFLGALLLGGCSDSAATGSATTLNTAATTTTGEAAAGMDTTSTTSGFTNASSTATSSVTGTGNGATTTGSVTSSSVTATGTDGPIGAGGATTGSTTTGSTVGSTGLAGAGGTTVSSTTASTATGGAGGTGTTTPCPPVEPLSGGQQFCSNGKGNAGNGYGYELWAEGSGSGCMTVHGVDATFSATWTGVEDFLARVGLDFDQTKTHTQIGTITADFAETKTEDEDGGLTYIGIYGWTVNPLREFYILDDWGVTKPAGTSSDGTPRNFAGMFDADGETYDVWTKLRENKPAITGDSETFEQYFSIRQSARQCGTISVSEHFSQWEALGLPLGQLHEVKWLMEAQHNGGSIQFTTATVTVH